MRNLKLSIVEKIAVILLAAWIITSIYVGIYHLPETNSLGY